MTEGLCSALRVQLKNGSTIVDVPHAALHVWVWFEQLNRGRGGTGFGALPLSWSDVAAWAALTGNLPSPWELTAIFRLDEVYLVETAERSDEIKTVPATPENIKSAFRAMGAKKVKSNG